MMTEINRDIDRYNEGIANGFSFRMIVCFTLAVVIVVGLTLLGMSFHIPSVISAWIGTFPAIILILMGIYKKEGFYLEDIVLDKIYRFRCWKIEFEAEETEMETENPNDTSLELKKSKVTK